MAVATSANYNKIIALPGGKKFHSGAHVDFADGTSIEMDDRNIMQGYPSIDDKVSEDGKFEVGGAYSSLLTLKLNNFPDKTTGAMPFADYNFKGAVIRPWIGLTTAVHWNDGEIVEKVPKGVFTVTEAPEVNSIISITGYDNLSKMDVKYADKSTLAYPATLAQIAADACSVCGVNLATTTFPNSDYVVAKRPSESSITCREVLSYVAQLAGCFARCNVNGEIEIRWYEAVPAGTNQYSGKKIEFKQGTDSTLASLTVTGKTVETGTGDKSPDNPYALLGTQNIKTCKKNLLPNSDFAENTDGWQLGTNVIRDPSVTLDGSVSIKSEQSGLSNDAWRGAQLYLSNRPFAKPGDRFTASVYAMTDDTSTLDRGIAIEFWQTDTKGIRYYLNRMTIKADQMQNNQWKRYSIPMNAAIRPDCVSVYIYFFVYRNGRCWFARPQIEYGNTATDYEPYQGQTFALPQPLYSLPGGVADEYDVVGGAGTQRVGKKTFDGTEGWVGGDAETPGYYRWKLPVSDAKHLQTSAQQILCTHYPSGMETTYYKNQSISLSTRDEGAFYLYDTAHAQSGLADWKAYLAAQSAAGTPVTVLYELATPQAIAGTPQSIQTYAPKTIITNDANANMVAENNYFFDVGKNANSISTAQTDTTITGIQIQGNDNDKTVYKAGTDDFAIRIQDNPLAQDGLQNLVNALGTQLINTTFRSYSTSTPQNPAVETGDIVYLTDKKGIKHTTIVSSLKIEFESYETFGGSAESEKDNQSARFDKADKAQESADDAQQTADDAQNGVKQAETEISQLNGEITLKADKGKLISQINVCPESIKISSDKIEITGEVVMKSDLEDGYTTINGACIQTGRIEAENGNWWLDLDSGNFYLSGGEFVGNLKLGNQNYIEYVDGTMCIEGPSISISSYRDTAGQATRLNVIGKLSITGGGYDPCLEVDQGAEFHDDVDFKGNISVDGDNGKTEMIPITGSDGSTMNLHFKNGIYVSRD